MWCDVIKPSTYISIYVCRALCRVACIRAWTRCSDWLTTIADSDAKFNFPTRHTVNQQAMTYETGARNRKALETLEWSWRIESWHLDMNRHPKTVPGRQAGTITYQHLTLDGNTTVSSTWSRSLRGPSRHYTTAVSMAHSTPPLQRSPMGRTESSRSWSRQAWVAWLR